MSDMRASVIVDLAGNLTRRARQYGRALSGFSKRGQKSLAVVQRSAHLAGQGLDKMGNRWTGMITGAAGAATLKMLLGLDERMERLGIQSGKTTGEMDRLKQAVFQTAQLPDIKVDPGQIIGAVEEIVEKTGDLDFAHENLENLAIAIQATGAQGAAIGSIAAEFQKMGIVSKGEVREALDILTVQGKAGAFTLQNLAALGSRTVTAYTAMGRTGVPAIREMGAALQVIREGTGSSEQATTAFEALLRTLGNAQKVKKLQAGGIQVFDLQALKEGREELRPINELMVEIVKRTQGKKTLLSQVFDEEAMKAFNSAASEFKRTGTVERLDKFMNIQADGSAILGDSARAARTASNEVRNLFTAWQKFSNANLTGPIRDLSALLNKLSSDDMQTVLKVAGYGAGALVGRSLVKKGYGLTKGLFGSSNGGSGNPFDGVSPANPLPVLVTNPTGGDLPSGNGDGKKSGKKPPKKSVTANGLMRGLGVATTVAAAASYAYDTKQKNRQALKDAELLAPDTVWRIPNVVDMLFDGVMSKLKGDTGQPTQPATATSPKGLVEVKISAEGTKATVQKVTASGMDLDVDNGAMMVGH